MSSKNCHACGKPIPPSAFRCPECQAVVVSDGNDRVAAIAQRLENALGEHYRVEELIGQGGAAVIFRVYDETLDRQLAAKVLNPDLNATDELTRRFRREIHTAAHLTHPNVVPIHFVGSEEHIPCYIMPLVEGESLGARLRREGQLPSDVALGIAKDIGSALDFAHEAGVIHRDVKPDNILLEFATGRSLLMDFGIAKAFEDGGEEITGAGAVVGTPHYLSPEQAAGDRNIDGRADTYSLGVVVYEMLAGTPPFTGRTSQAIFAQHISAEIPGLEPFRPGMPQGIQAVLNRAMAKEPDDRFQSAGDFVRALEKARGRNSLRTSGATRARRSSGSGTHQRVSLEELPEEPALRALMTAEDVTAMNEATEQVERFVEAAAGRGEWEAVTGAIKLLKRKTRDTRATFRDAPKRALRAIGERTSIVEGMAREWKDANEQAQARLEEALSASAEIGGQLVDLAIRECSAELMLLADRVGALTEGRVDALAHDTRVPLVRAFVATLRESQRPTATIERWLALLLQHGDPEPRLLAVEAAAERGGPLSERIGRLALGDPAEEVRVAAVRALGRAHRREALPDLARVLDEGTTPEQVAATEALGELGIPASVTILGNLFERTHLLRKERGPLQEAAAAALARLPSDAARDILRTLVRDRNKRIAEIAQAAVAAQDGVPAS